MNVLSLFNGCGGAQMAFTKLGRTPSVIYSSEVDKYAISVNMANYPNTVQVGDVRNLKASDFKDIDFICGGSPCQSFSFAGKRKGMSTTDEIKILSLGQYLELKKEGFEFEGQSYLFWEFVRLVREIKPKYFFLENVVMAKEWEAVISEALGVKPMKINSALVSAQNRVRLYWFNFGKRSFDLFGNDNGSAIPQPKDSKKYLKDVLESGVVDRGKSLCVTTRVNGATEKHYKEKALHPIVYSEQFVDRDKSYCIDANYYKGTTLDGYLTKCRRQIVFTSGAIRGRRLDDVVVYNTPKEIGKANLNGHDCIKRVYSPQGKSPTLTAVQGGNQEAKTSTDGVTWRKLTPIECERLQGMPDNYTDCVSNSQRYKMIGNGWQIDTIAYLFNHIEH